MQSKGVPVNLDAPYTQGSPSLFFIRYDIEPLIASGLNGYTVQNRIIRKSSWLIQQNDY